MAKEIVKNDTLYSCYARVCESNIQRDADVVVPDLAVSIDDMLQTGVVKNSGETLENNGIDSPDQILGRVKDVFDAIDASRVVKKYGKKPVQAQEAAKDAIKTSDNTPTS